MINIRNITLILIILSIFNLFFSYAEDFIGKEVILEPIDNVIYFGINKDALNGAIGNIIGDDKKGYLVFFLSHQVFEINQKTKAVVLDVSYYEHLVKVKILEGVYKDKIGWVLLDQISKS